MLLGGQFGAGDTVTVDRKPDDDGGGLSIETSREPVPVG
jgi:hypothetical protein